MVKKGKVRICITLDEFVYKKLCYETDKSKHPFTSQWIQSKSQFINELIDCRTKYLELDDIVKK